MASVNQSDVGVAPVHTVYILHILCMYVDLRGKNSKYEIDGRGFLLIPQRSSHLLKANKKLFRKFLHKKLCKFDLKREEGYENK